MLHPSRKPKLLPLNQRGPLRVMFLLTSMPVGGAETLLLNLVRRLSDRFSAQICCLKELGELGESVANELPVHHQLIHHKYDVGVVGRLRKLFLQEEIDAVVTVGAGDKMFWGRIAAKRARIPVIAAALHSTGWPDGVGRLNRSLTPITDAFIAVANSHGRYMVEQEKFPKEKVVVIPNGIDTDRFCRASHNRDAVRLELGIDSSDPVCGIIAALRPEKNHLLFLRAAALSVTKHPRARFLIVGDGPERSMLETSISDLSLRQHVLLTGSRPDVPELLSAMDLFSLTSQNEASPVSIMEAMAMELPVVAPNVGSIGETVQHGQTGWMFERGDAQQISDYWSQLWDDSKLRRRFGIAGREVVVRQSSLDVMVRGYEELIESIYTAKSERKRWSSLEESNAAFGVGSSDVGTMASS